MANTFKAGEGNGGWIQYAPGSWKWDSSITWKQTEKDFYLHYPKGYKFEEERKVTTVAEASTEAKETKPSNQGRSNTGRLKVGTNIVFVKYPEKGPRQMMSILEKLEEFGAGGVTIGMFWEKLEGQLATKQSVDRVYKHYHREMVDKGYIRITS